MSYTGITLLIAKAAAYRNSHNTTQIIQICFWISSSDSVRVSDTHTLWAEQLVMPLIPLA